MLAIQVDTIKMIATGLGKSMTSNQLRDLLEVLHNPVDSEKINDDEDIVLFALLDELNAYYIQN